MEVIVTKQNKKGFYDMTHELKCTINACHESTEKTGARLESKMNIFTYDIMLVSCH